MLEPIIAPDGSITVPGGATYVRTPESVTRRSGDAYVEDDGATIVTDVYPEGLVLYPGEDAAKVWQQIRSDFIRGERTRGQTYPHWRGHVYLSESGLVLLNLEGRH